MKYFKLLGPDVLATTDIDGKSLLHIACENNQPRVVGYLLQRGVDPNREEEYGNTALIMTSADGHEEIVDLLIQAKADLDKKSLFNHTALMLSALQGHEGVVRRLIEAGANVNVRGKKGYTALHYAAEYAQAGVIWCESNARPSRLLTRVSCRLLVQAKADLTIQNNEHKTAAELAIPILADLMFGAPPVVPLIILTVWRAENARRSHGRSAAGAERPVDPIADRRVSASGDRTIGHAPELVRGEGRLRGRVQGDVAGRGGGREAAAAQGQLRHQHHAAPRQRDPHTVVRRCRHCLAALTHPARTGSSRRRAY